MAELVPYDLSVISCWNLARLFNLIVAVVLMGFLHDFSILLKKLTMFLF